MNNPTVQISVISNIILEPYFIPIVKRYLGNDVSLYPIPYEEYTDIRYQHQISKSEMIIIWLNFESMFPEFFNVLFSRTKDEKEVIKEVSDLYECIYMYLAARTNARIIWFLFEDYYTNLPTVLGHCPLCNGLIDKINMRISETLCDVDNISFIDLKHLIAEIGIANAYNPKGKYRWNAPYSKLLIEAAVKEIHKQYLIENGITKKCLVLDCDNVLWGGILSDDGIENIKLGSSGQGREFQDFQRFVLSLYYHGVILAVCSKNDLSDVMNMFRNHSEMILKEKHIACFQVNWDNKPGNIKKIAETLNIGLDSIVFVDDSPFEVEAVKSMLPAVTSVLYEKDTIYSQLSCFCLRSKIDVMDIEKRNETYRTNRFRKELKMRYESYDDYIAALETKVSIHKTAPAEINRIAELTQRTNRCTNGKRYTVSELKGKLHADIYTLYSVTVSDKFSDLGLVGVIGIEGDVLDLFALSCRALGRNIENQMTDLVKKHCIKRVFQVSTGKNDELLKKLSELVEVST